MTSIKNHSEYVSLVNTLKVYDYQYFTLNQPTITDAEYDRMYFLAQDYEQRTGDVLADSPTQQCYSVNGNGRKQVAIRTELLSIEKASSPQKLAAWFKKTEKAVGHQEYTVEWKYDGVTCTLVYLDGQLASAAHGHGEGFFATDCLDHVRHMESVPQHIDRMGRIEVRGEIICPQSELHHIGKANERTAAASVLNTEYASKSDCERLCFFAFELIGTDNTTYWQDYHDMQAMGFTCVDLALCNAQNIEDIIAEREQQRDSLPFPTDGLVIKVNNKSLWESLGRVKHHRKHNVAYKFQPIYYAETTYTGYYTTVGEKTGRITYIAQFEPVTMNGSTFDHASCGSERTFNEKNLQPGCRIRVSSHGDVGVFVDGVVSYGTTDETEEDNTEPQIEQTDQVVTTDITTDITDITDATDVEEPLDDTLEPIVYRGPQSVIAPQPSTINLQPLPPTPSEPIRYSEPLESEEITNTLNPQPSTLNPKSSVAKKVCTALACIVGLAGVACVAYCAVGLLFFLPLILKR